MTTAPPLLEMRGIDKRFGATHALKGIDLTLDRGEVLGLIGENGAGKSTIIKILSGAYPMDSGEIFVDGDRVQIDSPRSSQELGVSTIYQELTLFPDLSTIDNILIAREPCLAGSGRTLLSPLDRRAMRAEAERLMRDVLGLHIDLELPVRSLSLAEKQLVEVARSLYADARIIIMDEPTEALESTERERLFDIIARLRADGRAVIYVSHLLDELVRISDRVMVMRDGENVATSAIADVTIETIITQMIGRDLGAKYAQKTDPRPAVVLDVRGVGRAGRFDDVTFDLHEGEILGIAGLDGAGKKDFVRSLFQATGFDEGDVLLNGAPLDTRSIAGTKKAGIGLLPADRKTEGLFLDKSIEWNVTVAALGNSRASHLELTRLRDQTSEYIASMAIRTRGATQTIGDLSGGNQQKALLARWLLTKPRVLILEEPTRGVDIMSKAEIYRQITAAAADGTAFIVVSSDSPELLGLCHRILVMHSGRVAADLDAATSDAATIAHYAVQSTGDRS